MKTLRFAAFAALAAVLLCACPHPNGHHSYGGGYTVTFDSNGGTLVSSRSAVGGDLVSEPLPPPDRPGYIFAGWFSEPDGGYLYTWPYTVTGDVTMYAQWHEILPVQYTVTFDPSGGTGGPDHLDKVTGGTALSEPSAPVRPHYDFAGWSETPGGTAVSWPYTVSAGHTTLYARWTPVQYTLTFKANGGYLNYNPSLLELTLTGDIENPVAAPSAGNMSTFLGWFSADTGGHLYTWPHTMTGDITVWAHWSNSPPASYSVTFDLDSNSGSGATGGPGSHTAYDGSSILEPGTVPTRTGYTFAGWYNMASGGTQITWPWTVTGPVTFYAHWVQIPVITSSPLSSADYGLGRPASLNVSASVTDGGTLSYQWYRNTGNTNSGGTAIPAATGANYTPPTNTAGTVFYYVVVTNTLDGKSVSAAGNAARITVQTLAQRVAAASSGDTITLYADEPVTGTIGIDKTITLTGDSVERTLTIDSVLNGAMFSVAAGGSLTLDNNVILKGKSGNTAPVVTVNKGFLVMEDDSKITGNYNSKGMGGGVNVASDGTFTMKGGTISDNMCQNSPWQGGGVYVAGKFMMKGGIISGNKTPGAGGGVYVASGGTFIKSDTDGDSGTIYGLAADGPLTSESNIKDADNNHGSSDYGYAVCVGNDGKKKRDKTAGPTDNLDSTKTKADGGGWD